MNQEDDIQPSKAAKASAVLAFTSGIEDSNVALDLYDKLMACQSADEFDSLLGKYGVWEPLDSHDAEFICQEIEMLAKSITLRLREFGND